MLPKIPKKQFEVKSKYLPNGRVNLVPFTVGQEQHLIQVKDSESDREKILVLKQIIEECIQNKNINVSKLPLFLIEEIFLRLFQHSSGEFIDLAYQCTAKADNEEKVCGNRIELKLDVRDFKIVEEEGHTNKVSITENIGIQFKYPDIEMNEKADTEINDDLSLTLACIDLIFDENNVYDASEYTKEEVLSFWNELTLSQKKEVYEKFFLTLPHLHYEKEIECKKCGTKHKIEFNSLLEVFT